MAIKFSQFNLRTDHTSGMYLVGYDGNQNIHITVDNLFNDFINGTENTIAMFGTGGTVLADSILSQNVGATLLTVGGQLNVDAAATFDTSLTVTGDSTLNGNVILGNASADLITQTGTLYLNGPVKDTTNTLGVVDQVLLSDASGELTFTDLSGLHVGGAEVVEVPVKNTQGSALVKGDPVYISGSVGASGKLEVKLADASNTLKIPAVGLLKQDLANNAEGFAVVTGKLRNLITNPIDGVNPTENDVIYVKPSGTSGAALTTTKPVYGNFIQNIGKVGRVSTSNDGNLVVSSILRTNDIPNLTPGKLWVGSTGNTIESQTLFVDEANTRLGIGTTAPSAQLQVQSSNATAKIFLTNNLSTHQIKSVQGKLTIGADIDSTVGVSHIAFEVDGNEKARIDGTNVGIGTTSPAYKTTVYSDSTTDSFPLVVGQPSAANEFVGIGLSGFVASNGAVKAGFVLDRKNTYGVGDIHILNNTTTDNSNATLADSKFTILQNGNVGIGTTAPNTNLEVSGIGTAVGSTNYQTIISDNSSLGINKGGGIIFRGVYNSSFNESNFGAIRAGKANANDGNASGYLSLFYSNGSLQEGLRIKESGNVGIGTASPGQKLHVAGDIRVGNSTDTIYSNRFKALSNADVELRADNGYDLILNGSSGSNVGIGTTSPGQKLEVDGNILLQNNDEIRFKDSGGTERTAIELDPSNNFNIGTSAGGNLRFINGSSYTERMRITSTGYVGIGTDAPGGLLHVSSGTSGDAILIIESDTDDSDNSDNPHLEFRQDGNTIRGKIGLEGTAGQTYSNSIANATYLGTVFQQPLQFITGDTGNVQTAKMTIQPNTGFVGIGTTSPSQKLEVAGNIQATGSRHISASYDANHYIRFESLSSGGVMKATDGGVVTTLVRSYGDSYFNGGNFGIGEPSPAERLHISGSVDNDDVAIRIDNDSDDNSSSTPPSAAVLFNTASNNGYIRVFGAPADTAGNHKMDIGSTAGSSYLTFSPSSSEKMRIESGGNIGIGTASPSSKLQVDGAVQVADDTDTASASKVGALRYRTSGNNSYVDMCMQTGASTYAWVNIVENNW